MLQDESTFVRRLILKFISKLFIITKHRFYRLFFIKVKGTDQGGTFMSLKCVVYYANYRS